MVKDLLKEDAQQFQKVIRSRRCCSCNFDSLLLTFYKYTFNSSNVTVNIAYALHGDIKRFKGTQVKIIKLDEPFSQAIENNYIKILKVHCTNCDWNKEPIAKGPLQPTSIGYSPHAISDSGYNIPRNKCLAITAKGTGCKSTLADDDIHLCHKHYNESNKKVIKAWFRRRGLHIDLT